MKSGVSGVSFARNGARFAEDNPKMDIMMTKNTIHQELDEILAFIKKNDKGVNISQIENALQGPISRRTL